MAVLEFAMLIMNFIVVDNKMNAKRPSNVSEASEETRRRKEIEKEREAQEEGKNETEEQETGDLFFGVNGGLLSEQRLTFRKYPLRFLSASRR